MALELLRTKTSLGLKIGCGGKQMKRLSVVSRAMRGAMTIMQSIGDEGLGGYFPKDSWKG